MEKNTNKKNPEIPKNNYQYIPKAVKLELSGTPNGGIFPMEVKRPVHETLAAWLDDTLSYAQALSGEIKHGDHFFDGKSSVEGAYDGSIPLDKSARPAHRLFRIAEKEGLVPKAPHAALFANIDKEHYLPHMGFEGNLQDVSVDDVDIAKFKERNPEAYAETIKQIRSLGLSPEDSKRLAEDEKFDPFSCPTYLDGKKMLIMDEVKSSGSTLKIALQLFRVAYPETSFDGYWWSTPKKLFWDNEAIDKRQFAVTSVPVWYNANTDDGRGVHAPNRIANATSKNPYARNAPDLLSSPERNYHGDRQTSIMTREVNHDFRRSVQQWKLGEIAYISSAKGKEYYRRMQNYYPEYPQDTQDRRNFTKRISEQRQNV